MDSVTGFQVEYSRIIDKTIKKNEELVESTNKATKAAYELSTTSNNGSAYAPGN
jgi:hypothetical protein